ncbi:MAG: phosphoenolpyruvate carboxylase [Pseudohongiellaceae bacterium]|jgi:phosphoenolpyruvate carboxylase
MPKKSVAAYENLVELKYQLYNGLFLTLPLDAVEQTGLFLPLLEQACAKGLEQGLSPTNIIDKFFEQHRPNFSEKDQIQFLFKIIQYVERQIVLIDALEDAAFSKVHQIDKSDELRKLFDRVAADSLGEGIKNVLKDFATRVVLTAHPTQFYPSSVLAIISDLQDAIKDNDIAEARTLLQQLGNTPFFNKQKPTPKDEAIRLTWYLSNIFYPTIGKILDNLASRLGSQEELNPHLLSVGFWPGGDRDGNPFVKVQTTLDVAAMLRKHIIECYHNDIGKIKRRLSYLEVQEPLDAIQKQLYRELSEEDFYSYTDPQELIAILDGVEAVVEERYQGLFNELVVSLKRKIRAFGFHFASLDLRQDGRVLSSVLKEIEAAHPQLFPADWRDKDSNSQIDFLMTIKGVVVADTLESEIAIDTLQSIAAIKDIQRTNGELGCHRYIISNCSGAFDMAVLHALFRLAGWGDQTITVDLIPLFETVKDLARAGENMTQLYSFDHYRAHLAKRGNDQTVMLGFSDGTKDGGYLMANWAIYQAKENITAVSRDAGIEVAFFDGRGGPPARGGGNTYKFYAALGKKIESNDIQVTIQGQTISSQYGTTTAARHNLHQLLAAGVENNLYDRPERELTDGQRELIQALADTSLEKYLALKNDPLFLPYLEEMSPMHYYGQSNIASRPTKRGGDSQLKFEDLRAIPFVGAWGQLKQNVPGFYGVGAAIKKAEKEGKLAEVKALYRESKFFRALLNNSMQSMMKANFSLTAYMAEHPVYGNFWRGLEKEFRLSKAMILKVAGQAVLLEDDPSSRQSIGLRQQVVLPLLVVQQYALIKAGNFDASGNNEFEELYDKMIIRSLFGNINASRNSA